MKFYTENNLLFILFANFLVFLFIEFETITILKQIKCMNW